MFVTSHLAALRAELAALSAEELVERLCAESRAVSHHQAQMLAAMVEIGRRVEAEVGPDPEQAEASTAAEIAAALHLTRRASEADSETATLLCEGLPALWEALYQGDLDWRRALTLARGTSHLSPLSAQAVVTELFPEAISLTSGELFARLRRVCLETEPEEGRKRYEQAHAERRVVVSAHHSGTADLCAYGLPPHRAMAVRARLEALARAERRAGDPRTSDQLRADLLLELLEGSDSHRGRGTVNLTIDLPTLAGLAEAPGELAGFGPIIAELAREVLTREEDGEWRVIVTDQPESEQGVGPPLYVGTTKHRPRGRRPSSHLQRRLAALSPRCVFPGCRMPAEDCDLDHTVAYALGGCTRECNLAPLCRFHHRLRHQGRWTYRRIRPGVYRWESPLRQSYTSYAAYARAP